MDRASIRARIQAINRTLADLRQELERGFIDSGRYSRLKADWERQKAELEAQFSETSPTSLIINPGFEDGFVGWREHPDQFKYKGQSVEDTTESHTGQRSRKLFLREGGSHIIQEISLSSPLPNDTQVTLTAWVKMPHAGSWFNKFFTLELLARGFGGQEDTDFIDHIDALPDWSQICVGPLVTKFPVTQLEIHAMTSKGDGSYPGYDRPVWVDDFELSIVEVSKQEKLMSGIPAAMFGQIHQALLDCGPFADDNQLKAVFAHPKLKPWQHSVPQVPTPAGRVDAAIAFLIEKRRADTKENALVLLLRVLSDRLDPADECHPRLARLANELEYALGGASSASSPVQTPSRPGDKQPPQDRKGRDKRIDIALTSYKIPPPKERFLSRQDRLWLARSIGGLTRFQDLPGRRNLLIDSEIPDAWIGEISLDRGGTVEIAKTIVNDLELRGQLPRHPQKHALGALLEELLNSFGLDDATKAVAIIFRYQLVEDQARIRKLSERFRVPSFLFQDEDYEIDQPPRASLPAGLEQQQLKSKLEDLYYNGRENWLDVNFLENGARAARSVCRLEWNKRGQGTGFLVAPDLILTNYHVVKPSGQQGGLETRLRQCEVRFGAVRNPDGSVSAGSAVIKLHKDSWVSFSKPDQLDYALLKLREPVADGHYVVQACLSDEPIYKDQYANIIQHPLGGSMKVALRYNQIVETMAKRVYYLSDTLKGSSGSPVFDDEWRIIALHRASGLQDKKGRVVLEANEGIPISAILNEIRQHLPGGTL